MSVDDKILQERLDLLDQMDKREQASFVLGMSYQSARLSELNKDIDQLTPSDEREIAMVKESLIYLGLKSPMMGE